MISKSLHVTESIFDFDADLRIRRKHFKMMIDYSSFNRVLEKREVKSCHFIRLSSVHDALVVCV